MPIALLTWRNGRMVGVAVIGLGRIGRLHAGNLAHQVPGARLAMVVDAVPERAERGAGELGTDWSASPDDALERPDVDAVVIAAPTPLHAELIERAAAAGRHVFCEKPLGTRLEDVERAVEAMRDAGLLLQPGFQRRFDEEFIAAKLAIESGELGRVELLRLAHRNRTPPHDGDLTDRLGSIFVDMTVHDFDTARWLVGGDITEVHAFQRKRNTIVVVHFAGGGLGVIDNCRHAGYGFECSAEVVGGGARLRIGMGVQAADNIERHGSAYRDELRHFVGCVERGDEPCVTGEDAIAALRLALMAEASAGVAPAGCAG